MAAYALDEDAAWRATLGTCRYATKDGDPVMIPDFTRAMASDLLFLESHPEQIVPGDFEPFVRRGTAAWDEFFSRRKVVDRVLEDGRLISSVTSNKVEMFDGKVGKGFRPSLEPVRGKQFDVAALLTDFSLTEKFGIKGSLRVAMRNMAAVDTGRAARALRDHIRKFDGYERADVVPGSYASSWKAARETLKLHAARFPPVSVTVDAVFIGRKIFIYGEHGEDGWRVFGPETVAALVRMVHAMVAATSPESVAFALGPELTLLDIDVHDGEQVLCPVRERHAGSHDELPIVSTPRAFSFLSSDGRRRLQQFAGACETLAADGIDCATAVRISPSFVLVNAHVVAEGSVLTSAGRPVSPVRLISRDLWLARCEGQGVLWPLREPVESEEVVLCYKRHGVYQFGGPVVVASASGEVLTLTRDECMRPGVSGAAVIALSDFALLGVYDGVSLQRGLVSAFTAEMFSEICASDVGAASAGASAVGLDVGVMAGMRERGLGKIAAAAFSSLVALYVGSDHLGMGFSTNGKLYTTCDVVGKSVTYGLKGLPLVFAEVGSGLRVCRVPGLPVAPALRRAPAFGDDVFVVGCDNEGHYCSSVGSVASVRSDSFGFSVVGLAVDGFPCVGGLILARADAAVVGVYSSVAHGDDGVGAAMCQFLPAVERHETVGVVPEAGLSRVFPFLNPGVWESGAVAAVLTYSPGSSLFVRDQVAFAAIGRSAMQVECQVEMFRRAVPSSAWSARLERTQSDVVRAEVCTALGLAKLLRGVDVPPFLVGGVNALLLQAVAGAVYLYEKAETFHLFCEVVKAVPSEAVSPPSAVSPLTGGFVLGDFSTREKG